MSIFISHGDEKSRLYAAAPGGAFRPQRLEAQPIRRPDDFEVIAAMTYTHDACTVKGMNAWPISFVLPPHPVVSVDEMTVLKDQNIGSHRIHVGAYYREQVPLA